MPTWQELEQLAKNFIRPLKGRRREQSAFAIAALCFSAGRAVGDKWLPEWNGWRSLATVQIALYTLGGVAFAYAVFRVWRLTHATDLPPVKDRPSVIKGPSAFTPGDGELFRRLGRESELQELMGYVLDNQTRLVVLMGESGAGKTSLVRAGLPHILKDKGVRVHYWEAVPTDSAERLLRAIQEDWSANGATTPAALDELINPSTVLGAEQHVIVLDQFEQLRGRNAVLQFLRRVARESLPPHRLTWIVAFRREYRADWADFMIPEHKRGFYPKELSLRLFSAEAARDVIIQLIQEADLQVEQPVVNNLIEAAANADNQVSPVDIGIGLLVLSELHERLGGRTLTVKDYQFAGGAEGLLTQYINRCLERFAETEREPLLKALLALRNPATNQRLAEGLPLEQLATEAEADPRRLQPQLDRLAQRDIRLLETVAHESVTHYRLPHERLIPALHRLTGKLLGEIEQARLRFENAFLAWEKNDKRAHYLLKGKDLKLIERNASQMLWGSAEQEKQTYLRQSLRRRSFVRMGAMAAAIALMAVGWGGAQWYQRYEGRRYLSESGYPPGLYDYQHQLKKLEMTEPLDLERFNWFSSDSTIEELFLKGAESSNSIAGLSSLAHCPSLKKLTLDLSRSQVGDLTPLAKLTNLTHLTLDLRLSQVNRLEPLTRLNNLAQLTLDLSFSRKQNVELLAQLTNTQLALTLHGGQVTDEWPKAKFPNLTELTIDLIGSQFINAGALAKVSSLKQLTIYFGGKHVVNVEPLAELNGLTHLSLVLRDSQVSNLAALAKLSKLKLLTLNLSNSEGSDLGQLVKLRNLTQLALYLGGNHVDNVEMLLGMNNIGQLILDFQGSSLRNLDELARLGDLKQLTLELRTINVDGILESLVKLKNLSQLTLDSRYGPKPNFESLVELSKWMQFSLYLHVSQASDLEWLTKLSSLKELILNPGGESQVTNWEALTRIPKLQKLSLENVTKAQRMSLQKLPASVVELRF